MGQMKCVRCGRVEDIEAGGCTLCGGDLINRFGPRPRRPSVWRYLIILLAGLTILLVSAALGWFLCAIILILCLLMAIAGIFLGHLYPEERVGSGLLIGLPYAVVLGFFMLRLFAFTLNPEYDGHFWNAEFYPAPAFLYLSPLLASVFGIAVGAKKTFAPVASLAGLLVLACITFSTIGRFERITKTDTFTFDLATGQDVQLQADIKCEYMVAKDYWKFINYDRGDCTDTIVTVIRKREGLSLPIDAYWTIDGTEEHASMWPINGPDDTSTLDYSKPHQYDDIRRWRSWSPFIKVATSREAAFRWGDIRVELSEQQHAEMKVMLGKLRELAGE